MKEQEKDKLLNKLITDDEIRKELIKRKKQYDFDSVPYELKNKFIQEGWEIDREFKTKVRMKKLKPHDRYFEDKVWVMLAQLGFTHLNRDRNFKLPYDDSNNSLTQQIDVFAKDNECVLIVECKAAKENKKGDFKKELEAMSGKIGGIIQSIKILFPDSKLKIKYILATENYAVSTPDSDRLANIHGVHFSEETVDYYSKMFSQIGLAARYQLLGSLFFGQDMPNMENKVPAIMGKMGGHKYYSFSIEPYKLLKIGYVLHRNKANINMMPTYQRIIKKGRLKSIHEFIDIEKGYFPNSIVISIDSSEDELQFDQANTKIGILHLPKKYRSVYIIDGQHRLYGYANSEYRFNNTIPVVAFLNLSRSEQVKLFMQINENQKAVSKNLRNTLNADLLWSSSNYIEQMTALRARIAIFLSENRESPLFDLISIGEDKRAITTQAVDLALKKSEFLGKVTKNKIEKLGTFFDGNPELTYEKLALFLMYSFEYIKDNATEEWNRDDNIILLNKGIYGLIMIFSDIVDYLFEKEIINITSEAKDIFSESKTFIDPIINFYKNISPDTKSKLKKAYGGGGDLLYWKTLQIALKDTYSDFNPTGLEEYIRGVEKGLNLKAIAMIRDIETQFKIDFKEKLIEKYGTMWFKKGVPPKINDNAVTLANQKNREIEDEKNEVEPWDCINIIAYREIAVKNWRDTFEHYCTLPSEEKKGGNKEVKTNWMVKLEKLRNQNFHSYFVTEEEISFLEEIQDWVVDGEK